ncbi:MAG: TlpA family protein disulfide reductase [Nocardioidaceae bacterium]
MMRRTAAAAAVLLCAVACAPPTSSSDDRAVSLPGADLTDVDVDAPELARQKRAAGIEDCPTVDSAPEPVSDGLPELTLPCLGGGPDVNLAALRGEPTVVNLWASWCGPCVEELPALQRLHESDQVRVLGVDVEDPQPGTALDLAADSGVTYPSLADPAGKSKALLQAAVVPQTVFVAADGTLVATERKPYTDYRDLADDVREHLGVRL